MRKGMQLYRYDIACPPNSWSTEYKSTEYQDKLLGYKNKIGAFFFYDNCCDCFQTALNAVKKYKASTLYMTTCQLMEDVNILHLQATSIYMLITVLYEKNIDVLTEKLVIYKNSDSSETFCTIRDKYADLNHIIVDGDSDDLQKLSRRCNLNAQINSQFDPNSRDLGGNYGYFGQLLTDFSNGIIFRELLQSKGYEGYCFYEGCSDATPQVTTYCLFSSAKLSAPVHREYNLNDVI